LFNDGGGVSGLSPEVGGEESVGLNKSFVGGSEGVLSGVGATFSGGVAIVDTSHLEDLLRGRGGDQTGTSGGRDESNSDGTALTGDLGGDGVGLSDLVTPVTLSDGDEVKLGVDDGTLDGTLDFLVDLSSDTEMAIVVTDEDNAFESGSLTGSGLLLDGLNLHDFFLELTFQKGVDNLGFLNRDGESVDFFDTLDSTALDKSAELGDWVPFFSFSSESTLSVLTLTSGSTGSTETSSLSVTLATLLSVALATLSSVTTLGRGTSTSSGSRLSSLSLVSHF